MEELIYNILAIVIVAFAFFIAGRKVIQKLKPSAQSSCDSGCGGCTSKCDLKDAVQNKSIN